MQYLIFGPGRVGQNMTSWLRHLGHEVTLVPRPLNNDDESFLHERMRQVDIIAAAIPDSMIGDWYHQWSDYLGSKYAIHFSGAINIEGMYGFHPLYSFPNETLSQEKMETIAFACPQEGPSFSTVFPGAQNVHFQLSQDERARYHALAVLSGNFVSYIWNQTAKEIADYCDTDPGPIFQGYLASIIDRFTENPLSSLTGPIARHDKKTVEANLAGLKGDPKLTALYQAFLQNAWPDYVPDSKGDKSQ